MADIINVAEKQTGSTLSAAEFNEVVAKTNAAIQEQNETKTAHGELIEAVNQLLTDQEENISQLSADIAAQTDSIEAAGGQASAAAQAAAKAVPVEFTVPFALIDGVADADGLITGTKTFDLPLTADLAKPVQVFNNGLKVKVTKATVNDVPQITLPVAPLGDGTEDGSSVVEVLFYLK